MGMGEPLANFDAVVTAVDILRNDLAYMLSKYRVTLRGCMKSYGRLLE